MGLKRRELAAIGLFLLVLGGIAAFWGLTTPGSCTEGGKFCSSGWPLIIAGLVLMAVGAVAIAVDNLLERRRSRSAHGAVLS